MQGTELSQKDTKMNDYEEQRKYKRYVHESPLSLYYNENDTVLSNAVLVNYSRNGMCFETSEKLKVGDHISIRMENIDDGFPNFENEGEFNGYIRWIEELENDRSKNRFGYGIQKASSKDC